MDRIALEANGRRRPFFDRLAADAQRAMTDTGVDREFVDGEVVVAQGERACMVGLITRGLVKVTSTDPSGRTALLEIRGVGDVIGLVESCGMAPRSSAVVAVGAATVHLLGGDEFVFLRDAFPSISSVTAEVLAERVADSIAQRVRAGSPVASRLASCLLMLAAEHGTTRRDGAVVVAFPLTQDELASFVDASRDAVARTLMRWRRMQIVETGRRRTVITDLEQLADRVGA